jgi:hypothetical protein
MTYGEAHREIDLLLDKADQAYFTMYEKDKFLTMALMEWFEEQSKIYDAIGDNANMLGLYVMQDIGNTVSPVWTGTNDAGILIKTKQDSNTNTSVSNPNGSNNGTGISQPYNPVIDPALGGTRWPVFKILKLELKYSGEWYSCKRSNIDEEYNDAGVYRDPFNKATSKYPKYFIRDGHIKTSPSSIQDFKLTYLTYPIFSNVSRGGSGGVSSGFSDTNAFYGTVNVELGARCLAGNHPDTSNNWVETDWDQDNGIAVDEQHKIIKRAVRMLAANTESPLYKVQQQEIAESR